MDIELRLLRSFVQIYESGSLSRAAERMSCTQAAMSMRLKMLETELGAALFARLHHRLEPTARGAELYAKALGVLAAYDEMMSVTRARPKRERVRIGLPDDYAMAFLGPVLTALGKGLARLELSVECDLSANLMASVQRHDLDLALVTVAARPARAVDEWRIPLRWLVRPGAAPGAVLAAYPEGCVFRKGMIETLERAERPWQIAVQSRSHAAIMAAVRAGVAVTSVALGTGPDGLQEIEMSDLLPPLPEVPLFLVTCDPVSPGAKRLARLLREALAARFAASAPIQHGL